MKPLILLLLLGAANVAAQTNNVFIGRDFWKTDPSIADVEQKIAEGNSPTELNRFAFDAIVYAFLEKADNEVIKHLLTKEGNGVNKLTHDGRTYIFWAAYKGNLEMMEYLLAKGAKTDIVDDHGYSILNFAANAGQADPALYDLLIGHGADPAREKTHDGAHALLLLLPNMKDLSMVDYFTKKGLSIQDTDTNGNGLVAYAARKGNRELIDILIEKGLPYKNLNKKGGNVMLMATKGGRGGYNSLKFFQYLDGLGINPNSMNEAGRTPLHNLASGNKDVATLTYFMDRGVDVNQTDEKGNTALILSAGRNSPEVIRLLQDKTKDINHTNKGGHSALTKALGNSPEVVSFLLDQGADVSAVDTKGNHLGYHLFKTYDPKKEESFMAKLALLENKGLDVTLSQKDGNTLYHLAVEKQSLPLLEFIEKYDIDINAKNETGTTPLQKAVMTAKNDEIIKYLIAKGADTTIKTDFDESIYDLAMENEALKTTDISFLKQP